MSNVPPGAGTYGATAGLDRPVQAASDRDDAERSTPSAVAAQGKRSAAQAAGEVTDAAKDQAQRVAQEARTQARSLAADVRDRVSEQARTQNDRLVGSIRQTADQLDEMRGDRTDSPAAAVVSRVAEGGRQFADYLDQHGPEGVLREVQDFARRRPGAFLATALAAGFVVGRLGKSVAKADSAGSAKPDSDAYVSRSPEPVTTEYAATGTGTPTVVREQYATGPSAVGYPTDGPR